MTEDPINVSALNQYGYCPRRCGLIYLEGEFEENVHTARGRADHERVDRMSHETSRVGARVEYALPVWCDRLGLVGKCDIVEFWPDGLVYPVEYKHGPRRARGNDDLQLAAQATCLAEMTGRPVRKGAIYHVSSRRRREIVVDEALTRAVEEAVRDIRTILQRGKLPPPVNDGRCRHCSLHDLCQPAAIAATEQLRALRRSLFNPG